MPEPFKGTTEQARSDFVEIAMQAADGFSLPPKAVVAAVGEAAGMPPGVSPHQAMTASVELIRRSPDIAQKALKRLLIPPPPIEHGKA